MLRAWSGEFEAVCFQLLATVFTGLMYFCMDDMRAIRSLVNTLRIPSLDTRVRHILLKIRTHRTKYLPGNYSRYVL